MRLQTMLNQWDRFWFRTTTPHVLAIFRIALGSFLLLYWGMQIPNVALLYSREGLLMPLMESTSVTGVLFAPPPPWLAAVIFWVFLLALLSFTIGWKTNASACIAFLLYCYFWVLTLFQFGTSFDRLFIFSLLVLTFSGCGKTFSVDIWRKRGSWTAWEEVSILPQRILAVQIAATYLGVGWQKLILPDWRSGEVLAYGFVGRWATPPAWWIARLNLPLSVYDAAVWVIKAFEISMPFGLWFRRTQWWFFLGGALFHIGIAVLLNIWWFLALIPAYVLFIEPERINRKLSEL